MASSRSSSVSAISRSPYMVSIASSIASERLAWLGGRRWIWFKRPTTEARASSPPSPPPAGGGGGGGGTDTALPGGPGGSGAGLAAAGGRDAPGGALTDPGREEPG